MKKIAMYPTALDTSAIIFKIIVHTNLAIPSSPPTGFPIWHLPFSFTVKPWNHGLNPRKPPSHVFATWSLTPSTTAALTGRVTTKPLAKIIPINKLIIFLFMATFAQFAFVIPSHPTEMTLGYLSIVVGALLWWFGLTWLVDKVRGKFDESGILILNKIIGSVVIVFSLVVLIGTVFNLYTFHY